MQKNPSETLPLLLLFLFFLEKKFGVIVVGWSFFFCFNIFCSFKQYFVKAVVFFLFICINSWCCLCLLVVVCSWKTTRTKNKKKNQFGFKPKMRKHVGNMLLQISFCILFNLLKISAAYCYIQILTIFKIKYKYLSLNLGIFYKSVKCYKR